MHLTHQNTKQHKTISVVSMQSKQRYTREWSFANKPPKLTIKTSAIIIRENIRRATQVWPSKSYMQKLGKVNTLIQPITIRLLSSSPNQNLAVHIQPIEMYLYVPKNHSAKDQTSVAVNYSD